MPTTASRRRARSTFYSILAGAGALVLGMVTTAGPASAARSCPVPDNDGNVAIVRGTETAHLPGATNADFCGARPDYAVTQVWNDGPQWNIKRLAVPGVGTWRIAESGRITFVAAQEFLERPAGDRSAGRDAMLKFKVIDAERHISAGLATVYVLYPGTTARPDVARTDPGTAVVVRPLRNDVASWSGRTRDSLEQARLVPSSLSLVGPGGSATAPGGSLTTAQGSWRVDDGKVTFTPADSFTGTTDPMGYRASDSRGETVESTITVTVGDATGAAGSVGQAADDDPSQVAVAHTGGERSSAIRAESDGGPSAPAAVWLPMALVSLVAGGALFALRRRRQLPLPARRHAA